MTIQGFGKRFRRLRGDMTQHQFADLLGISQQRVSEFERGTRIPTGPTMVLFNKKTKVSLDWLILGRGEQRNA